MLSILVWTLPTNNNAFAFYNPSMGRWLNRDPVEEKGGLNLYATVNNTPLNKCDKLGLSLVKCPGCGPDVTASLQAVLQNIRQTFMNDWNFKEKESACEEFYNIYRGGKAWDIDGLYNAGKSDSQKFDTSCGIMLAGEGKCAKTVTFNGNCYYASAANYAMWGLANKLCSDTVGPIIDWPGRNTWSLANALVYAVTWKVWLQDDSREDMLSQVQAFTRYGYLGELPQGVKTVPCDKSSCTVKGKFDWVWKPVQK